MIHTRTIVDAMPGNGPNDVAVNSYELTNTEPASHVMAKTSVLPAFFALLILLFIAGYFARNNEKEYSYTKISVANMFIVGSLATAFIFAFKVILNKYPIKGFTDVMNTI
jgi:glucan phosphoethanolaminetransferase (alkaline phosphatase superfamily)